MDIILFLLAQTLIHLAHCVPAAPDALSYL